MPVLYFHVLFPFRFLNFVFSHSFGHPLILLLGGGNSLPPSVFAIDVGGWVGVIPGVLLRFTRACTLGVARMLARVVGVDEVCALFCCCVSKFSVALSNIFANFYKAWPCRPVFIVVSFNIFWMEVVRDPAIFTTLSIGVNLGIWTWVGYSLYWADVL